MPSAYDLIIFDCDGVLVDSEVLAVGAMLEVLNDAGVPATAEMIGACFGMKQADILARLARETGVAIPEHVSGRLWPTTKIWFERDLRPMPGVTDFIRRAAGLKRCVASSSGPDRIETSLRLTGLSELFGSDVFSSNQVERGKPAPDLFLFAADRMKVAPHRCAVVEDSIFGVEGARAAGMTPFGFAGGSHIPANHAERLLAGGAVAVERSWDRMAGPILGSAAER